MTYKIEKFSVPLPLHLNSLTRTNSGFHGSVFKKKINLISQQHIHTITLLFNMNFHTGET